MTDTVLSNARLVLPDEVVPGSLRMAGGRIRAIDPGPGVAPGAIDCEGDLVLPGLIELHTDNLERHIQPRPGVDWPHAQAILAHDGEIASTGITTVYDALRVGSVVSDTSPESGEYARGLASEIMELRARGALRISHFLHLRAEICSETLVEELARFGPEDRVGIVSMMDHTPGQRQFRDMGQLRRYFTGKRGIGDAAFEAHVAGLRTLGDRMRPLHEPVVPQEAARLGAVLASHDDTTADHVRQSAARGVGFAEFPTTEDAARACRAAGIAVMMGAPNLIRGGSHSGNVAASDLARADLLDILSSDYVPAALLTGALMLGDMWGNPARGIATVTAAPARVAGLDDRGRLELGRRADVIRVRRLGNAAVLRGIWVQGRHAL